MSDWKSLNYNPFSNATIVSKFAYSIKSDCTSWSKFTHLQKLHLVFSQLATELGVRPHPHVYTTVTQLNIAYNWNIIHKSTLTHALLLVVLRPSLPPNRPTLPKPSLPRPSLPTPSHQRGAWTYTRQWTDRDEQRKDPDALDASGPFNDAIGDCVLQRTKTCATWREFIQRPSSSSSLSLSSSS